MNTDVAVLELPGFDTVAALKMLNNNQKLYSNVLKRFLSQYSTSFDALSVRLHSLHGDPEEISAAQREVHTLKGLAGTIGHPGLQEAAVRFDAAAKEPAAHGEAELKDLADSLLSQLALVLDTLKAAFPEA